MWFMAGIRNILRPFYWKQLAEHKLNLKSSLLLYGVLTIVYGILTCRSFGLPPSYAPKYNTLRFKGRFSPRRLAYFFQNNRQYDAVQSNPVITTSVYTTPRLQRQTFCSTN